MKAVEAECRAMQREGLLQWVRDGSCKVGWKLTEHGAMVALDIYDKNAEPPILLDGQTDTPEKFGEDMSERIALLPPEEEDELEDVDS